jgi:hypothetical protein
MGFLLQRFLPIMAHARHDLCATGRVIVLHSLAGAIVVFTCCAALSLLHAINRSLLMLPATLHSVSTRPHPPCQMTPSPHAHQTHLAHQAPQTLPLSQR